LQEEETVLKLPEAKKSGQPHGRISVAIARSG